MWCSGLRPPVVEAVLRADWRDATGASAETVMVDVVDMLKRYERLTVNSTLSIEVFCICTVEGCVILFGTQCQWLVVGSESTASSDHDKFG